MGVDELEYGQEALSVTGRLEALQRPFSSPRPLVRVLCAVVQIAALTMLGMGQSGTIATQPVGHNHTWFRIVP